jgi:subtilisin-like proprotein convertase family protein
MTVVDTKKKRFNEHTRAIFLTWQIHLLVTQEAEGIWQLWIADFGLRKKTTAESFSFQSAICNPKFI